MAWFIFGITMYSHRLHSCTTSLNPTGLRWCSRCSFNWKWELGHLHSSHPAIIFSRDLGTQRTSYVTNEMRVASCCIRSHSSRQHPLKSGVIHLVQNNPFKTVWGSWSVASSVVNLSTIFKTKLLSNKLCQRKKKKKATMYKQCTYDSYFTKTEFSFVPLHSPDHCHSSATLPFLCVLLHTLRVALPVFALFVYALSVLLRRQT